MPLNEHPAILRLWHDIGCPYCGSMDAKSDDGERIWEARKAPNRRGD